MNTHNDCREGLVDINHAGGACGDLDLPYYYRLCNKFHNKGLDCSEGQAVLGPGIVMEIGLGMALVACRTEAALQG